MITVIAWRGALVEVHRFLGFFSALTAWRGEFQVGSIVIVVVVVGF